MNANETSPTLEDLLAAGNFEAAEAMIVSDNAAQDAAMAAAESTAMAHYATAVDQFHAGNSDCETMECALQCALENMPDCTDDAAQAAFCRIAFA